MIKNTAVVVALLVFCLVTGINTIVSADADRGYVKMMKHIEKVKRKNPAEYRKMFEKAGGIITDCINCHRDFDIFKKPSGRQFPKSR